MGTQTDCLATSLSIKVPLIYVGACPDTVVEYILFCGPGSAEVKGAIARFSAHAPEDR